MHSKLTMSRFEASRSAGTKRLLLVGLLPLGLAAVTFLAISQVRSSWAQEEPGKLTSTASSNIDPALPETLEAQATTGGQLFREGTKIVNQPAICRSSGDRLQVILDQGSVSVIALENLAAQRILKASLDDASDERWVVNGQMTEFQGHNYLLLDRVTRQAKP